MTSNKIPVDVLRDILEYVDKAGLATMCQVNKICCSCSQDVLYRDICVETLLKASKVQQTLSQSTHLARTVRSFDSSFNGADMAMPMALQNMTSLRILKLRARFHMDIFDGCTFKLDSFNCARFAGHDDSIKKFLSSQPSLKTLTLHYAHTVSSPLEATCLPNLTRIHASFHWLPYLIPGRPLNEVIVIQPKVTRIGHSIDLSFFALSTTPIQKLTIDYYYLHPTPTHLLASFLPSLTHFTLTILSRYTVLKDEGVCGLFPYILIIGYLSNMA